MHHFVLPSDIVSGPAPVFPAAQSHQIARVLRLRAGDEVVVLDGLGRAEIVTLTTIDARQTRGLWSRPADLAADPELDIEVFLAIIRPERFEWALQKGTEIGVSRFVPLQTARCVRGDLAGKTQRLETIVREATEQCHRHRVPRIDPPLSLVTALEGDASRSCALVMLHGDTDRPSLPACLPAEKPDTIRLLIGPEGGWDPAEVALAQDAGALIAALGPRILRAETAALVAATLCLNHYGDL